MEKANNPLMKALHFNSKDLDANRDGILSWQQRKRIWQKQSLIFTVGWTILLFMACGTIVLGQELELGESTSVIVFLGLIFPLVLILLWLQYKSRLLIKSGQVEMIHGTVKIIYRSTGRGKSPYLIVAKKDFPIEVEVANAFERGKEYVIYFLHQTDYLVAAEQYIDKKY